ncbi:radical SAM protein [Halanaerobacter jeridensis]|uniref:Radical SAM superfamily enzyme YgiQ (UPF0313 family) n=1 Tax=Halanaerobacter jeridensis TaxID=706427 RepID=A0A939BPV4_9FIRM|nr:radical SAM protein [Halanaerobacter jeridensis]MBM7557527.1 radical SAM superfamily enzyme YgiQ (UPF0313 family) [Halanaerobacter jeridensis]
MKQGEEGYQGFEIGPIRPPSEANSLLLRLTRNCPWNQCNFCGLYKGQEFSLRPKAHILKDIDLIKEGVEVLKETTAQNNYSRRELLANLRETLGTDGKRAYHEVLNWYQNGMKTIFLQDANSLIMDVDDLVEILNYLNSNFPEVERITSYARSHTIALMSAQELQRIAEAGLTRLHIGLESGSDQVLDLINKGVTQEQHITAGQKIKETKIELSEYFMPGLGGVEYSEENALETAKALNQINPDFIRIRTLVVTDNVPLKQQYQQGVFSRTNDQQMVEEILLLIKNLTGISSTVKSDHILNLIPEVEGGLPADKSKMIDALQWFLDLTEEEQMIFRLGRRTGIMQGMNDLRDSFKRERVKNYIAEKNISAENVDDVVDQLMKRYI